MNIRHTTETIFCQTDIIHVMIYIGLSQEYTGNTNVIRFNEISVY